MTPNTIIPMRPGEPFSSFRSSSEELLETGAGGAAVAVSAISILLERGDGGAPGTLAGEM
jgi:hypothetical protein